MTILLIAVIAVVWIVLSGLILVSVSMMSSQANRTELIPEDQLPRRRVVNESEPVKDTGVADASGKRAIEPSTW